MSKKQCQAKTKAGTPCNASASENGFCFTHDVTRGKERAEARRKGGLQKITPHFADVSIVPKEARTTNDIFLILDYALQESLVLQNSIQRGRLLVSLAHGYIEALKVGELEKRIESLEIALKRRNKK